MAQSEIDNVRALLQSKPRPVGWAERRHRLDDIGSVWPVADDVKLETVDVDGMPGESSIAPNSDFSRVLVFFHGGGYCSGSIVSHRRMVTEAGRAAGMRTLAIAYRLANVAGAADAAVTLEIWPQMIHAWPLWNAHLEAGRRALANAGAFIRAHL